MLILVIFRFRTIFVIKGAKLVFQIYLVHNRSELNQGLILYPSVRVAEASDEEVDAIAEFLDIVIFEVLDQIGHVFDADFPHTPDFIRRECFKCLINFANEGGVV